MRRNLVNGSTGVVIGFRSYADVADDPEAVVGSGDDKPSAPHLAAMETDMEWPLVRFTNGRVMLCVPEEFTVENAAGTIEAKRTQVALTLLCCSFVAFLTFRQVPLILAWALSVHKSQGQTLERVKIDMRQTFEKGQGTLWCIHENPLVAEVAIVAYVAMSRATSLDMLEVTNFDPLKYVS